MEQTAERKKDRYQVEIRYGSKKGNLCSCRRVVRAYDSSEAMNIVRGRVEKFKNYLKGHSGDATNISE